MAGRSMSLRLGGIDTTVTAWRTNRCRPDCSRWSSIRAAVSAESLRADMVSTSWSVASIAACQFAARTLLPVSTKINL